MAVPPDRNEGAALGGPRRQVGDGWQRTWARWNPDIGPSALLQAGIVAVGFVVGLAIYRERTDETARGLATFKSDTTAQLSSMQMSMQASIEALRGDVRAVPTQIQTLQAQMGERVARDAALEARIVNLERDVGDVRANEAAVSALLNQPLRARAR